MNRLFSTSRWNGDVMDSNTSVLAAIVGLGGGARVLQENRILPDTGLTTPFLCSSPQSIYISPYTYTISIMDNWI